MKKSNRQLAQEYLAKAAEEDRQKVQAFSDACFTDAVLNTLAPYTKTDFKKVGKIISEKLVVEFVAMKQKEDAETLAKAQTNSAQNQQRPTSTSAQNPIQFDANLN